MIVRKNGGHLRRNSGATRWVGNFVGLRPFRTKVATVKHVRGPSSEEKVNMDRKRQRSSHNSKDVDKKTAWKKKDSKIVAVDHEIEQLKAKYNEVGRARGR